MSLKIDRLQLEIVINNDQSRKQLRLLEDEAKKLKRELKKLPEASDEYVQKSKRLKTVQTQMDGIINKIGLTGLSMKELSARQRELNAMMKHLDPRLSEYKKLDAQLQKVKGRMAELRNGARKTGSSMKKLAGGFNHYIGVIGATGAAMAGMIFSIKNLIEGNAKLSDSFADVRKTTGLSDKEVKELSRSLKKIDTRSPRSELLNLARIAGKLGVEGKENIFGFVKAADQINVALSEDLGGNAEEAIRQLGKLVDVFKIKDEFGLEQGLLKVGSAINALGAASTANEAFIVGFTQKIGGSGKAAGFSIPDILGLASTMDILGATSEISTTAIQKMLVSMGKDIPHFAGIAGMELEDFSKLLEDDVNEAFLKVLEGAKSSKKGLAGMVGTLESLGIESARAAAVASLLTQNTETLREQQKLANKEFEKGTSLTEEFNIKNNTLAARLDKLGKKFRTVFYSSGIIGLVNKLTDAMFWLVENLTIIVKVLGIATVALVSYTIAKKLAVLWTKKSAEATILETLSTKINAIAQKGNAIATSLSAAAHGLLTGNLKKARTAMIAFSTATKLSPIGLLVGIVTAAATAFMMFKNKASDANKELGELAKGVMLEKTKVILLIESIMKLEEGNFNRLRMLKELNEKYPDLFKNIDLEKVSNEQLKQILTDVNDQYLRKIKLAVKSDEIVEAEKKATEAYIDQGKGLDKITKLYMKYVANAKEGASEEEKISAIRTIASEKAKSNNLSTLNQAAKINEALFEYRDLTDLVNESVAEGALLLGEKLAIENEGNLVKDTTIKLDQLTFEQLKNLTDAQLKYYNITREWANELAEIKRKAAEEEAKQAEKLANKGGETDTTAGTKTTKFDPTKLGGGTLDYIIKKGEEQRKVLQTQRSDEISDLQESFDRETTLLKTELNKQLLAAGDNEEEKARLKQKFRENELLRHKEHLDKLVKEFEDQLKTGGIEGLNIEQAMLSDEEKEALQKKLGELKLALTELNLELDSLAGPKTEEATDLFGMTDGDWDRFLDKFNKAMKLAGELNNMWAASNQIQANRENAELRRFEVLNDKKKKSLDQRLADGLISEEDYTKQIENSEILLENKRRNIAIAQDKRQKEQAYYSTILNTAAAMVRMLVDPGGLLGFGLSVMAGIAGALQLKAISSESPPQYYEGGYTDVIGEKDGKKYRAKLAGKKRGLIKEPSILTAEKKPEYVVPGDLLEKDIVQNYVNEIERMRLTGQFYEGGFTSPYQMNYPEIIKSIKYSGTPQASSINTTTEIKEIIIEKTFTDPQLVEAMNRFSGIMERIDQNGLEVPWNKIKEKNDQYDMIQEEVNT